MQRENLDHLFSGCWSGIQKGSRPLLSGSLHGLGLKFNLQAVVLALFDVVDGEVISECGVECNKKVFRGRYVPFHAVISNDVIINAVMAMQGVMTFRMLRGPDFAAIVLTTRPKAN